MNNHSTFNFIRSILWPIHRHELPKFLPMLLMAFLLSFNQCVLWNMKDALMVTTSGAEVIPFVKVWAILPSALLMTLLFAYLSNRYSQQKVFYLFTTSFLLFYGLFAFVLYPYRDLLHPSESAAYLESILPGGLSGLVSMYRHWTFTLFYVICELWNSMIISVLFWSFANLITRLSESARFYGVFSIGYNSAIIFAGGACMLVSNHELMELTSVSNEEAWGQAMMLLISLVMSSGVLIIGAYRWMHQNVLKNEEYEEMLRGKPSVEKKGKLSFIDSVRYVCQSRYLLCIAVMVLAYGLTINLIEVVWKDQLRNLYPITLDYNNYMSYLQIIQGVLAVILSLGIAEIVKRHGWTKAALVTPVMMGISCLLFFGVLFFHASVEDDQHLVMGINPFVLIVFLGAVQISISKACKYSLFDTTKEMAFIPLSKEMQLKGKAAIDGVGYRLGKSGGSIIHQGLLIVLTTVSASAPYVAAILAVILMLWIMCTSNMQRALVEDLKYFPSF